MENSPVYVYLYDSRTETFQTDVPSSLTNVTFWLVNTVVIVLYFSALDLR